MTQTAALDKAFKLFHEKKFADAQSAFQALLEDAETPSHVRNRVQHFTNMCEQQTGDADQALKPDQLTVSYFLNKGDLDKAEALLADSDFDPGRAAFLRAEIAVSREDYETAAGELKVSIEHDRSSRGYAINSPTFMGLLQNEHFQFLQNEDED
jgi:hypothetical protein